MEPRLVLVDWGTTSFRLWIADKHAQIITEHREVLGMSKLQSGDYASVLEGVLKVLGIAPNIPVLICGMAGAAQGWQDAGYNGLPYDLRHPLICAEKVSGIARDVRIIPGLAKRDLTAPDVIRGEETMLLGAFVGGHSVKQFCLPGTHSKWVQVKSEAVVDFRTYMTGELYSLLKSQSTLSHYLASEKDVDANNAKFSAAVRTGAEQGKDITNLLFSLRSGPILFDSYSPNENLAILSGILIGSEVASATDGQTGEVGLVASGNHLDLYSKALEVLGVHYVQLDAEVLVQEGLLHTAKQIWPDLFSTNSEV